MYVPEKEALIWKIKAFPGGREFLLRCKFGLPSVAAEEEARGRMPPMRVAFEIPYFTVSGIQVPLAALQPAVPRGPACTACVGWRAARNAAGHSCKICRAACPYALLGKGGVTRVMRVS